MSSLINVGGLSKVLMFLNGGRFVLRTYISKNKKFDNKDYANEIVSVREYNAKFYMDMTYTTGVEFTIGRLKISLDTLGLELFINRVSQLHSNINNYFEHDRYNNLVVKDDITDEFIYAKYESKIEMSFMVVDGGLGAMFIINNNKSEGCMVSVYELAAIISYFRKFEMISASLNLITTYTNINDVLVFNSQGSLKPRS